MINITHNENCLDTMAKMEDKLIDLTVTSPPYDNLRDYNGYSFDFESIAKELYNKLWQADTESFLPHFCAINSKQYNSHADIPVLITDNMFILSGVDELINLMDIVIDSSKVKVAKLTEIVYQVDKVLESSRKKYMFYKKAGFEIESNKK